MGTALGKAASGIVNVLKAPFMLICGGSAKRPTDPEKGLIAEKGSESLKNDTNSKSLRKGDMNERVTDIPEKTTKPPSATGNTSNLLPEPSTSLRSENSSRSGRKLEPIRLEQKPSRGAATQTLPETDLSPRELSSPEKKHKIEVEAEIKRLRQDLEHTIHLYRLACQVVETAEQKAVELHQWTVEHEQRRRPQLAKKDSEEKKESPEEMTETSDSSDSSSDDEEEEDIKYRKYSMNEIEEATNFFNDSHKIGEGGYGHVYKCQLDHTPVAVKVLRPDGKQGRSQFHQEIEILCLIRHPNIVLLLGACPEYDCLVYEYMAKGNLEDCLFQRRNTPVMPWQFRFRIAREVAMGLLFLHQNKPEPVLHRDLKPGNVLLDNHFVAKISDVGQARLVPSVAENVAQSLVSSSIAASCYVDPEYQQSGVLDAKSDVYSFGILLLQLITGREALGLSHKVKESIEKGAFSEILDPAVTDWPVDEALCIAKIALQCAELKKVERPDLRTDVMPELVRLGELAENSMKHMMADGMTDPLLTPNQTQSSFALSTLPDALPESSDSSRQPSFSFPATEPTEKTVASSAP